MLEVFNQRILEVFCFSIFKFFFKLVLIFQRIITRLDNKILKSSFIFKYVCVCALHACIRIWNALE